MSEFRMECTHGHTLIFVFRDFGYVETGLVMDGLYWSTAMGYALYIPTCW
jgi:hypothetical protein